jgi:hypothetical protein
VLDDPPALPPLPLLLSTGDCANTGANGYMLVAYAFPFFCFFASAMEFAEAAAEPDEGAACEDEEGGPRPADKGICHCACNWDGAADGTRGRKDMAERICVLE